MKHSRDTVGPSRGRSVFPELEPAPAGALATCPAPDVRTMARIEDLGQLQTTALSYLNLHEHGNLLVRYLMARKRIFIDSLNWSLPSVDGMEFDQYDTPLCRWVVVHEFGEVLGGVRLVPTRAKCGIYTYMLRDAQLGLLESIPSDVLFFEAPVDPYMWEASRLFISVDVPARRRSHVQYMLMKGMTETARNLNARHVIGIVPWVWSRWLRRLGLYAVPVGRKFEIDGTASQAALFNVSDQMK